MSNLIEATSSIMIPYIYKGDNDMKRKLLLMISMVLIAGLLIGCSTNGDTNDNENNNGNDDEITTTFTLEELAEFDGLNGNPAYVAVDGIVYDVSNVPAWNNGQHNGIMAGGDRTQEIAEMSPHGKRVLNGLPVVGKLE